MRGTIEKIAERKIKSGKRQGEPYHIIEIDGTGYFAWEPGLIKGLSEGSTVEFVSEGDEYPTIKSISVVAGTTPQPKQVSKYDDTKVWNTCLMCATNIMVALINGTPKEESKKWNVKGGVIEMLQAFYKTSENGVEEEDETDTMPWMSKTPPKEEPPPEAGTTFDSLNYQIINTKWANKEELAGWWAEGQKAMLKMTEDERKGLIKVYSEELGKIK